MPCLKKNTKQTNNSTYNTLKYFVTQSPQTFGVMSGAPGGLADYAPSVAPVVCKWLTV